MQALVQPREVLPAAEWRRLGTEERIAAIWGHSTDDIRELCAIPWAGATETEKNAKVRIFEVLLKRMFRETDQLRAETRSAMRELAADFAERQETK